MKYLSFDIECCDGKHICEFGYVIIDEKFNVLERDCFTINPGYKFKLTGREHESDITLAFPEEVYYASPKFDFYYERIKKLLTTPDCQIVGFSLKNDAGFLATAYELYEKEPISFTYYDFQTLYQGYTKSKHRTSVQGFVEELIVDDLWTTTWQEMKKIIIPVPELDEQKKIAGYLDKKCEEIDGLIADIQSQIDILEQYKKSTITEAVIKGLNPTAELKDSRLEWIGDIPAHWEKHPIYYYFVEREHKNSLSEENNLLSLSYGKIIRKDINTTGGLLPESYNTYNIIEKDDIVLRLTDLQNDKKSLRVGIAKERGIITSAYVTLKAIKSISASYFYYLIHAYDLAKVLYNMGGGVRQGLNYTELSKLVLIEPPIEEQKAIAEYLDKKCAEIDSCIESKKEQIATLEAYKKSVIYEYVTGKKEIV